MSEHGYDGDHWKSCSGYGYCTGYDCDCDEKTYGSRGRRKASSSDSESAGKFWLFYIISILVGTIINEFIGVIMIGIMIFCLWARDH